MMVNGQRGVCQRLTRRDPAICPSSSYSGRDMRSADDVKRKIHAHRRAFGMLQRTFDTKNHGLAASNYITTEGCGRNWL